MEIEMKVSRIAVICVLLAVGILFSQSAWAKPAWGVKAGLNMANATTDPEWNGMKSRTGIGLGGSMEMSLTPTNKVTIRTDALYVMKGFKFSSEYPLEVGGVQGTYTSDDTYKTDEFVVAPFLVFRFPSGGATPFIQLGPEVGFVVTKKYESEWSWTSDDGNSTLTKSQSGDITDYSGMNFGVNLGGGVAIPAGNGEFLVDARYNLGLKNMYDGVETVLIKSIKTNGLQLFLGYNFTVPMK
jgi:hypothetical protein